MSDASLHVRSWLGALVLSVCKDDDRVEPERASDKPYAEGMVKRAQEICISDRMPEPLSTDESLNAKFCPAHEFCLA